MNTKPYGNISKHRVADFVGISYTLDEYRYIMEFYKQLVARFSLSIWRVFWNCLVMKSIIFYISGRPEEEFFIKISMDTSRLSN
jgi:hypothetical protein